MSDLAPYLRQPREVSIETMALCNARCTFCPYPTLERQGTRLPDGLIRNLIEQMRAFDLPFCFSPFKVNEPLLDTRLEWICRLFLDRCANGKLRLFTNGSPLTNNHRLWIASLPRFRIEHLWISLNHTDPDTYHQIMGLKFENVARNLDNLHAMVASDEFPHPVVLSAVAGPDFDADLFEFDCALRWPYFQCRIIKQDGWLGYVPPLDPSIPDAPCVRWWELSITSLGDAALCCMDGKGEFSIGSVYRDPLLRIYNQPLMLHRREHQSSRRGIHPCSTCTY